MRGVRRGPMETEMDGVKCLAVQGHGNGEPQSTDAQRRRGSSYGKMTSQEVGGGEIMSKNKELGERERLRPRGRDESGMERYRVGDGEEEENKRDSGKNMDVPGTNQPSSAPLSSSFSPFKTVALF